jgi:hypothetical protein
MRPLFLILVAFAVSVGAASDKKSAPLPPLNAKVFDFAKSSLGKPVGDGICITLAVEALNAAYAKRYPFDRSGDYVWGDPVPDLKDSLPGDILQFRDAIFHGQRTIGKSKIVRWHAEYPHHTAIVAKVEQSGKLITIYHQNVTTQGRKDSEKGHVQEGELRMESLQKGGWIKAYRPVPAGDSPARRPFIEDEDKSD